MTGRTRTATNAGSAEVIANNVYFGDSKRDPGSDAQYGNDEQEQFSELTDDDGSLPF